MQSTLFGNKGGQLWTPQSVSAECIITLEGTKEDCYYRGQKGVLLLCGYTKEDTIVLFWAQWINYNCVGALLLCGAQNYYCVGGTQRGNISGSRMGSLCVKTR